MKEYIHKKIEAKWQKTWAESKLYKTEENSDKPKCYVLDEFPYPSGEGLHTGHTRIYTASDIYARMKRMQGFNVLHPSGWDAFGLPAEQFAIKNKVHPSLSVKKNTERYKEQMNKVGLSYDWDREINTTDPEFYKWTQWIFLQMYHKGLAFESFEPINWCPSCQTGLANEDLEKGACERCGTLVVKKPMRQWVLRITKYADRLLNDLDTLKEWPEAVKESQRNWIGRSEGAKIKFAVESSDEKIVAFTTRPDTLFGVSYVVLAPEHELVTKLKEKIKNWNDVEKYRIQSAQKNEIDRTTEGREKTGVRLEGVFAINPANQSLLPVFMADYVLSHVGTGAVMAVPAHDTRDWDFAKKFSLPIKAVIWSAEMLTKEETEKIEQHQSTAHMDNEIADYEKRLEKNGPYTGEGYLINSEKFSGSKSEDAKLNITQFIGAETTTTYKLRDWVFSRQRYWGEPIPIIHCEKCGSVPVPEKDLPVVLPEVNSYAPTGTGESPLADIQEWVNTTCPKCTGPAKRETNTMPQWAGSSWYWLRFMDTKNDKALVSPKKEKYWSPVDVYVGGAEHVTRHLIYARFWHKFLFDLGVVTSTEPFARRRGVGLVLGEGGVKMSKRLGNVINPDTIVDQFGADSLRVYEMFMGPFGQAVAWSTDNLVGSRRFIERIWRLAEKVESAESKPLDSDKELDRILNQTIIKVGSDIENFAFNTAIAQLMIFLNFLEKKDKISSEIYGIFLILLAPFAPHITEERWQAMNKENSIHLEKWPAFDIEKTVTDIIKIAIQIDGKLRDTIEINRSATEEEITQIALSRKDIMKWIGDIPPKRIVYIPNKIINIVL